MCASRFLCQVFFGLARAEWLRIYFLIYNGENYYSVLYMGPGRIGKLIFTILNTSGEGQELQAGLPPSRPFRHTKSEGSRSRQCRRGGQIYSIRRIALIA